MIKIGDKLGNFLIRAEIGRGGMGTIYFAMDTMLNREVALKVIHPQLADNQQLMERFKIEAMTQARLNHPHIVTIFSFHRIEDDYIIAMEYVEGRSLKELLLEKKQLHPAEAVDIIIQIAEGLRYAHHNNVIHRDIKPANILIGKDGNVKISDFGIAKIFGSQGLTKTGILIGTPWYTSPEQIVGKNIDFRTDLYSLGVTFYEVLTGRVPFDSETNSEFQIQKAHLETPPPRPSIFNPEIGIKLEKIILMALQKKVEKRFQNARDMIDELRKIRSDMTKAGVTAFPDMTQKIVPPPKKGRGLLLMPLKILAFLALLVAGVFLFIFLSGKNGMDEGKSGTADRTRTQVSETLDRDAAAGTAALAESEAEAKLPNETQQPKDEEPVVQAKTAAGEPAPADITAEQDPLAQKNEPEANPPETIQSQEKGISPQDSTVGYGKLGNLDNELVRLRGFLEARNFITADRLADALIHSGAESRALPMLGRVKFLLNNFVAAEALWVKALQENLLVSLDMVHLHDSPGENCLGQLKFKKRIIMFNSNTRGDHSFALTGGDIRAITLGNDLRIIIAGAIGGQEIDEAFMVVNKIRRREKERFLVNFINQYVL
ncbi:MAG TPA: protein kinase [Patescibacteria group bacterium]|nr:protein kinase [Patescibacteria group bacterium]